MLGVRLSARIMAKKMLTCLLLAHEREHKMDLREELKQAERERSR